MEEIADKLYIIKKYIKDLHGHIAYVATRSINELIHFGISLCQSVKYLHNQENPIYHRDLQPSNLTLKENTVNLIDIQQALLIYCKQASTTAVTKFQNSRDFE